MKPTKSYHIVLTFALLSTFTTFCVAQLSAAPLGTAFTYHGRLTDGTNPATGIYDFRFMICDLATNGSIVAGPLTNSAVGVTNGLFMTALDFGEGVFTGDARWLEIGVRTNGSGSFTNLTPRQPLTPTPYALYAPSAGEATTAASATSANSVAAANVTGMLGASQIANGSIDSTKLAVGSVTTAALADGAVTSNKLFTAEAMTPTLALTNPVPTPDDWFGHAVAFVGGDWIVVGAPQNEYVTTNPGVAFLFDFAGHLVTTFTNPAPTANDQFGDSVAVVGSDKVLIGARRADTGATDSGAAYLFSTNGTLLVTFTNPTPAVGDQFGFGVAAAGTDKVLIGAFLDDTVGTDCGAVYLFKTDGTLLATFTPTSPSDIAFGFSATTVGGDKVLIGAPGGHFGAYNAGAAYLFHTNGTLLASLYDSHPATYGNFGRAVAAVGSDKVLIGAPYHYSSGVSDSGVVYLFSTNGTLLTTFTNPSPSICTFGCSLAILGSDLVLIGAPHDRGSEQNLGVSYLFNLAGRLLLTITNPVPIPGDNFGAAVAAWDTDRALIGASAGRHPGGNGRAYLFSVAKYAPGVIAEGVRIGGVTTASLADGAVTEAKLDPAFAANVALLDSSPAFSGTVSAVGFSGNGAGLTGLNATNITNGTVADARLSTNVALLNANQTFTGSNTFNGIVTATNPANAFAGSFSGNGTGLTGLNATNLTGSIADERLSANVAFLNADQTFTGTNTWTALQTFNSGLQVNGDLMAQRLNIGVGNTLDGNYSTIAGGEANVASFGYATVNGGRNNTAGYYYATVSGGYNNTAGYFATVGGGEHNTATAYGDSVGGGDYNIANGAPATVGGGEFNTASGWYATIAGGSENTASGWSATVGGGSYNSAQGDAATVGGGANNTAYGMVATVGGGANNTASHWYTTVGGGVNNCATNFYATVPGGDNNLAGGAFSFAAGHRAKAQNNGTFVWADATDQDFASTTNNQFLIRASGGVGINNSNPTTALDVNGTVTATAFNPTSDRKLKENFAEVSAREVLDKVAVLPITHWNFKGEAVTLHLGPMAQDFHAAFGLGTDDKHIATVDADGVALAAIQGLNQKLEETVKGKDAEIQALRQSVAELKELVTKLMNQQNGGGQ